MRVLYRQDAAGASSVSSGLGLQFCRQGQGGLADKRRRLQFESFSGRIDCLLFLFGNTHTCDVTAHRLKAVVLPNHKR